MARSFGRILASIWDDDDFRALSLGAQRMYMFLLTQSDLEHSGLIPLRERRWARSCAALDVSQVTGDIKELEAARFVVTDEETEELLVRSLIRRDEVWKQPNVFKAAAASAIAAKSPHIKAVLYTEIQRLDLSAVGNDSRRVREALLASLEPFANPHGTPPEPFARGSEEATGEGEGTCSSTGIAPTPFPDPPPPAAGAGGRGPAALSLAAVPNPEGEDSEQGPTPRDIAAFVAEIRAIRDEWSAASIRRALDHQDVRDRGWDRARQAMLQVARDPQSQHPGRLAHDGPWWAKGPSGPAKPVWGPWCGECEPNSRMVEGPPPDGKPSRCPRCELVYPQSQVAS